MPAKSWSHAPSQHRAADRWPGRDCPATVPEKVKMSDKPDDLTRFDLENERRTIINYRQRIRQADALGEYALSEVLRKIIAQEQDHLIDLADALGIDAAAAVDGVGGLKSSKRFAQASVAEAATAVGMLLQIPGAWPDLQDGHIRVASRTSAEFLCYVVRRRAG